MNQIKSVACALMISIPSISFAFFCPTNFSQIDFGMSVDQVIQICGKPDSQKDSVKQDENVPQEWVYFIPQTVSMGGSQSNAQGTLKTSITFNEKGEAINISVNGIGVGASTICGSNIQLGVSRDTVKTACGNPSFVNKQQLSGSSGAPQDIKITTLNYTSASPSTVLIFENGMLKGKQ